MINRPKNLSYLIIGCLFFLSMPSAGFSESAYEQLQNAAGSQKWNVPDPNGTVCVGIDCPNTKKELISSKTVNPTIAGMLAKKRRLERILTENIQKFDQLIQKCDERIASANSIIFKAQKAGNTEAEVIARQAANEALKAKKSSLQQKQKDEQQLRQVKEEIKGLSVALTNGSIPADTRGVVSRYSGNVSLLRANSGPKATSLSNSSVPNIGYLVPGDEIQTGNNSMAEISTNSGRGKITIGENSKLRVEEDDGDAEVVRTQEGKFHFLIDKMEKFEADLETDMAALKDLLNDSKDSYERYMKSLKAKVQKKFKCVIRSGGTCSVRGTEFIVNEKQDGSAEFIVIEGKVEVTEPDGGKSIMVETGQVVLISSDGKLSGVRQLDTTAIINWWEE